MPQAWEKSEWVNTRKVWHNPVFVLCSSTRSLSSSISQGCSLWRVCYYHPRPLSQCSLHVKVLIWELVLAISCITNKCYCINITWKKTYSGKRRSFQFKHALLWEAALFWNRRGQYKNHPFNCSCNHFHVWRPYLTRQHRVQILTYDLFPNSSTSLQHILKMVVRPFNSSSNTLDKFLCVQYC